MTKERLIELLSTDADKAQAEIKKLKTETDYLKELDPKQHTIVTDKITRPDKIIKNEAGEITKTEKVARLAIPLQKLIAQRAAAFLCANPIHLNATPQQGVEQTLFDSLLKTWEDNKLDFKSMDLAEKMMSETEVAELWYTEKVDPTYWTTGIKASFRFRMRVLASSLGDTLYPVKDTYDDLIAFGRGYKLLTDDGKEEEHLDIYTDEKTWKGIKSDAGWQFTPEDNLIGKMPIIYYAQPLQEWADVQSMIERLEAKISNHADTNDYFDSPIVFVQGSIEGFAEKGESGKVLIGSNGATAQYLTWNEAPASTKLEIDNLLRFIYSCTDTPDISFENLKGMGTTSGFALEMMFMGAHLKAARKAGIFGESIQRRINYLKAAIVKISTIQTKEERANATLIRTQTLSPALSLQIKPTFEFFLPKNIEETINYLSTAVTSGIISKKTAIAKNPLVEDAAAEEKQIEKEGKEESSSPQGLNRLMSAV